MEFETAFNQVTVFMQCILTGLSLGVLYDIIRGIRLGLKTKRKTTLFLDILYFILCGVILLWSLYLICGMQIRWYVVAGIIFGVLFYIFAVSPFILPLLTTIIKVAALIIVNILMFILKPIVVVSCYVGRKSGIISKFYKKNLYIFASFVKKALEKCKRIGIIIRKV